MSYNLLQINTMYNINSEPESQPETMDDSDVSK